MYYVIPLLDYCCWLYFPTTMKHIKFVESIQKHFIRHLLRQKFLIWISFADISSNLILTLCSKRDLNLIRSPFAGLCMHFVIRFFWIFAFSSNSFNMQGTGIDQHCEIHRRLHLNRMPKLGMKRHLVLVLGILKVRWTVRKYLILPRNGR